LSHEQSQFILASLSQLAKLNSSHLSTNVADQVLDFSILEQFRELWVGILAMLDVLCRKHVSWYV